MQLLSKKLLNEAHTVAEDMETILYSDQLPEKVIQFGEGNFLRAFVDWMFHRLNRQKLFNGKIVVVQPIEKGMVNKLNEQDGLYTLIQRGLINGRNMDIKEIVSSVSRGINPYENWTEVLQCAENPEIEYVVSNTTEAGIVYDPKDSVDFKPPNSFPGKLAVYMYHRYKHFNGDPSKGLVLLPCELIDRNGDVLEQIVLRLAKKWNYPEGFINWVKNCNQFLNTLVDRVVPGYPREEAAAITDRLGYQDNLLCTSELYHLWVIEGEEGLSKKLPFREAGLNVIWTGDMAPYRTRKVRILNGAHTSSVPGAYLYGLDTVGEMIDHGIIGSFTKELIFKEVIPALNYQVEELREYAESVFERFANPYIKHYLTSILLNCSSKYKTRVLPSILDYYNKYNSLPDRLVFSLAVLIFLYKDGKVTGSEMIAAKDRGEIKIQDDLSVLKFFEEIWKAFDGSQSSIMEITQRVLGNEHLWDKNLNQIQGLTGKVSENLQGLVFKGIKKMYDQFAG
ncbi:MAG: tagaturonate reductase [Bacillota bacterium]